MLNIIGRRKIFFIFSSVLIILSITAVAKWGLNFSIDFTGGAISEISFGARPDNKALSEALDGLDLGNITITPSGANEVLIRTKTLDEETHQKMINSVAKKFPDAKESRFDSIGPAIGKELKQKSIWAIFMVLLGISFYVSWAFRKVSKPISSWKYGMVSVATLFHNIIIPIGVFSVLGHYKGVQIDLPFIAATLTILGYSINDTIVVFDRTRENLLRRDIGEFEETVNRSVNQTLVRSVITSMTVIIVLLALYFFGGETLRYFALALLIGIITGTYASIFIASPLLVEWQKRSEK
ncbi:protein translocase subunit SecF [Patescibacteria group bacterium]|nr:protein translocase subunit SecF [Patescibacteria group bacterium]MBU4000208.1 protein translocase subunit SecF [Patescibacteria group bacterium]MBU4056771.1 protein translocase subunit SecF [Patescibacteria group bacterium]MBU4368242.1 protein translocase subunit SecF [Patescibacteria group bacterium]